MKIDYKIIFVKHNSYFILAQILIYIKGIILLPIIIKNFGVNIYGGYVLLMTGIGFTLAISPLGVGYKSSRYLPSTEKKEERREFFYMPVFFSMMMLIGVSALLLVFNGPINAFIFKQEIKFSMFLVILILFAHLLYSNTALFFRQIHKLKTCIIGNLTKTYLMIVIVAVSFFVFKIKTINSLLWAELLALIFVAIPLAIGVYRKIGFVVPVLNFRDIFKDIRLDYSRPLFDYYLQHGKVMDEARYQKLLV